MTAAGQSSLACRQLIVDTSLSGGDVQPQLSPLLRSLSARGTLYQPPPPPAQRQQFTAASPAAPRAGTQPSPAARQMSCPEPSASRLDFADSELVFNKWTSCVVSYVQDPENFYVQVTL